MKKKSRTKGDAIGALQTKVWDEATLNYATDLANDLYNEECMALRNVFQRGTGCCAIDGAHRMNIISVIIAAKSIDTGRPVTPRTVLQPHLPGVEWTEDDVRDIIEDPVNQELVMMAEEIKAMEKK